VNTLSNPTPLTSQAKVPAAQAQALFGRRVAGALDALGVHHDIEQRLRVARELAVSRAKAARLTAAAPSRAAHEVSMVGTAQAALGGGGPDRTPWWIPSTVAGLVVALVVGLWVIDFANTRAQIDAAAEVDAMLLSDALPPKAYTDVGFREFVRSPQD
jgi:hypothetical protein